MEKRTRDQQEVAIAPRHADFSNGDFLWRISSAPVLENTEFSKFPSHDRVLVILEGNGVRLNGRELRSLEPFGFSGAELTHCELVDGPVQDLSVFTMRDRVSAKVRIVRGDLASLEFAQESNAHEAFIFIVRGEIRERIVNGTRAAGPRDTVAFSVRDFSLMESSRDLIGVLVEFSDRSR